MQITGSRQWAQGVASTKAADDVEHTFLKNALIDAIIIGPRACTQLDTLLGIADEACSADDNKAIFAALDQFANLPQP